MFGKRSNVMLTSSFLFFQCFITTNDAMTGICVAYICGMCNLLHGVLEKSGLIESLAEPKN